MRGCAAQARSDPSPDTRRNSKSYPSVDATLRSSMSEAKNICSWDKDAGRWRRRTFSTRMLLGAFDQRFDLRIVEPLVLHLTADVG